MLEPDPETLRADADHRAPGRRRRAGARGDRLGARGGRRPAGVRAADRGRARRACASSSDRGSPRERGLHPRRGPHAVRALRRRARRRAPGRPRGARRALAAGARARTSTRRRSTTSRSATPTARARTTATSRAWRCCWPGCRRACPATTVNRLCGSSLEAAMQASRAIETGDADADARRRRRVDEPRAVGAAQARAAVPARPRDAALDHARLADGQPGDAGGVDDLARRERREAGRASTASRARRRTSSRCAATSGRRRPGTTASTTTGSSRARTTALAARRGHPRRHVGWRSWRKLKPAFAQGRHRHGGQRRRRSTTARARCCSAPRGRRGGGLEPLARIAGARHVRGRSRRLRHRARSRRPTGAASARASAGATSTVVELNEAFAAQSLACLAEWPELDPDRLNVNGGAIAIGHPLGASRRAHPRHARPRAARAAAAAGASRRSASASDRDSRWCWRHDDAATPHPPDCDYARLPVDPRCAHPTQPLITLPQTG